jgi:hypothetical protein
LYPVGEASLPVSHFHQRRITLKQMESFMRNLFDFESWFIISQFLIRFHPIQANFQLRQRK